MTDKPLPDHETIERVFKTEPEKLLESLPDGIASRSIKRLIPTIYDYAREAREEARSKQAPAPADSSASLARVFGCRVTVTEWTRPQRT